MKLLTALTVLAFASMAFSQTAPIKVTPQAKAIHDSAIVIDTHADTTQWFLDPEFDIGAHHQKNKYMIDLDAAREGNLGAQFFSIWVEPTRNQGKFADVTLQLIDSVYQQAAKNPDRMMMAYSTDDILAAHRQHKFAALMGIEGGHSIENNLRLLRDYYRLGVRYMTLTWSNSSDWAESSGKVEIPGVKAPSGLTDFGKQVVAEMNRMGMLVDISHVSDKTFWDTIAVTKAPIIASHSSSRALTNHPRNMTDDMLRAVAKNGGVVMVNYNPGFIDDNYRKAAEHIRPQADAAVNEALSKYKDADPLVQYREYDRIEKEWSAKVPRPPFSALIDHFDHIAKVAGIDHVGMGSDFDGITSLPEQVDTAADLPKITQALLDRGYNKEQIDKILGGNILRVFRQVEQVSRQLNAKGTAAAK